MSPPDTNLDRQKRLHRPALWGMALAVVIAVIAGALALTRDGPLADDQAAPSVGGQEATQ